MNCDSIQIQNIQLFTDDGRFLPSGLVLLRNMFELSGYFGIHTDIIIFPIEKDKRRPYEDMQIKTDEVDNDSYTDS